MHRGGGLAIPETKQSLIISISELLFIISIFNRLYNGVERIASTKEKAEEPPGVYQCVRPERKLGLLSAGMCEEAQADKRQMRSVIGGGFRKSAVCRPPLHSRDHYRRVPHRGTPGRSGQDESTTGLE